MRPFKPFSESLTQGMQNTRQNINRMNSGGMPSSFSSSLMNNQNNLNQNNLKLQKPQNSLGQQGGSQQGGQDVMGGPGYGPIGGSGMGTGNAPGSGWGAHYSPNNPYLQGEMEGTGHLGFGGTSGDAWQDYQDQLALDEENAILGPQGLYALPQGGYIISNMSNLYGPVIDYYAATFPSMNFGPGYIFSTPEDALATLSYLQNLQELYESGFQFGTPQYVDDLTGSMELDLDVGGGGSGGFDFSGSDFFQSGANIDWSNFDFNDIFSPGASNMRNQMFSGGAGTSAGISVSDAGRNLDYATSGAGRSQGFASQGKNIGNTLDSLINKYSSKGELI